MHNKISHYKIKRNKIINKLEIKHDKSPLNKMTPHEFKMNIQITPTLIFITSIWVQGHYVFH
jgi:hypothetical protein